MKLIQSRESLSGVGLSLKPRIAPPLLGGEGRGEGGRSPISSSPAFTLIEIALSLAIIGFALVAIIGVLPAGLNVQRENREETLINFDANFLMDAIRNGAQGQDDLTNYIVCVTNLSYFYTFNNNVATLQGSSRSYFTATNYSVFNAAPRQAPLLTNGQNIIGLISTPRYTDVFFTNNAPGSGYFTSNYVSADFRSLSGPAVEQGASQASRDFAFRYRLEPQIIPDAPYDLSWVDYTAPGLATNQITDRSNYWALAYNQRVNLSQIRLRFRWPVLANGGTGAGVQVFRSAASGLTETRPLDLGNKATQLPLYFIESHSYTNASLQ